ncbi:MAG TPA: thiamine phosphate synthase [Candidatus Acidoferrales bacterium]|nr:thiamine phosphate synthase [Candidatus Acidoferrales bacterium]
MKPIVCYVTDRKALGTADSAENLLVRIRAAVTAGVDWVQLRERELPARELLALTKAAIGLGGGEARIVVNDRLDVALAAGAAGVHLGGASLPANEVVRSLREENAPAEFLVGVSCHSMKEAREAENAGANYVFLGPVFDTPAKRSYGPPQGIARLAEVCSAVRIPVIAIGGVNDENGMECVSAGATGIAAIRMFQESRNPETLKRAVARLHGDR